MSNLKNSSNLKMPILFLLLILAWGLNWPVSKIALQYMPPVWFSVARLAIGTITMFGVVIVLRKFLWPTLKDLKIILIIGLLQIGLFMFFINFGLSHVPAGRSSILVYTTPLWVVPISIFIFKEKATPLKWLGFFFGIIGILILFNPFTFDWSNHQVLIGNAALLMASLSWAISMLFARYMHWPHSPLQLISWQLLTGTILLLCFAFVSQPHPEIQWTHALRWALVYSGLVATAFGYWGGIVISKELSPVTASLSLLGVPVCGVISSVIFLKEPITLPLMLAIPFIFLGIICVIISKRRPKKTVFLAE